MEKVTTVFGRKSNSYYYHVRGPHETETALVRDYQEFCWRELFGKKKTWEIVYELNNTWFSDGRRVILFNPRDPVEMVSSMNDILRHIGSNYQLQLVVDTEERHHAPALVRHS